MNIFVTDPSPIQSAIWMCNEHLRSKMILESAQMLANCYSRDILALVNCPKTKRNTIWKYAHPNHPCTIWCKASKGNAAWLCEHALAMAVERRKRRPDYNDHHSIQFIRWCYINIDMHISNISDMTPFAVAIGMDKNCRKVEGFNEMSVFNKYKQFIKLDKPFANWPLDRAPYWL